MTKKVRNTAATEAKRLIDNGPKDCSSSTASSTGVEVTTKALGLQVESVTQLAYIKKCLENSLIDWTIFSLALIKREETKTLLEAAIKKCDPPPQKSGPKYKKPDLNDLQYLGRTSIPVIRAEGKTKENALKAEQKSRLRALDRLRPILAAIKTHEQQIMQGYIEAACALGIIQNPKEIDNFIRAMKDEATALRVQEKASGQDELTTITPIDE